MATFTFFDEFAENMTGIINLNTDTFKLALTDTAPDAQNNSALTDITQIAGGNGYTAGAGGGATLTTVAWAETAANSGIWAFTSDDVVFTASGGDIATHRYAVLYSDTSITDKLIGYIDRGASAVITNGNTRTWHPTTSGRWFTLTVP